MQPSTSVVVAMMLIELSFGATISPYGNNTMLMPQSNSQPYPNNNGANTFGSQAPSSMNPQQYPNSNGVNSFGSPSPTMMNSQPISNNNGVNPFGSPTTSSMNSPPVNSFSQSSGFPAVQGPPSGQNFASSPSGSVTDLLNNGGFTTLADYLMKNGMTDLMNPTGPLTIFAPSNEAFRTPSVQETFRRIGGPQGDNMKKFLRQLAIKQKLMPNDIRNDLVIPAVSGDKLRFNVYGKMMTVNGVEMIPLSQSGSSNVAIYKLNYVYSVSHGMSIIDVLVEHRDRFSTLLHAIPMAGLIDILHEGGPHTFFAPTNDAFNALPQGSLSWLMTSPKDLKRLLIRHIVPGAVFTNGLTATDIFSADGQRNHVTQNGKTLMINNARILSDRADLVAENGLVHAVDNILHN